MAARLSRLVVALFVSFSAALPSAAAALVRPPTSQETAIPPVPDRGADPTYARSYFGARYYRAEIGRFTTIDPVYTWSENLADPQRWNRYAYVRNNPLRYTDPDGRAICGSAPCQENARRATELRKEFGEAHGLAKLWAGVKLALAAGEAMPASIGIAAEGGAVAQVVANGARGRAFEASVIEALGASKNTTEFVQGMTKSGVARSLPDLMGGAITEIKDVKNITFVKQLQVQYDAAKNAGVNWILRNLIVSPNTQTISQTVVTSVSRTGGTISVWDRVVQAFRPWGQ